MDHHIDPYWHLPAMPIVIENGKREELAMKIYITFVTDDVQGAQSYTKYARRAVNAADAFFSVLEEETK